MSFQAVTWAIGQRAGSPSAKATLWSIANYANENWCAWPSQRLICEESEQSPDSVQKRLPELEERGLIWRIPLRYGGRRTVDFVVLPPSRFFKASLAEVEPLLPRGCSIDPKFAAEYDRDMSPGPCLDVTASCGSAEPALPQTLPQIAVHAAALERQQEPVIEPRNQIDGGGDACAREPLVSSEAVALADEIAAIAGLPDPGQWPPGWCGAAMRVQAFLASGYLPSDLRIGAHAVMANKRDGPPASIEYFKWAFAKARGQREQPVPSAIHPSEGNHAQANRPSPIAAAADRIIGRIDARIAELEAAQACNGAGENDARLLPQDRSLEL